MGPPMRVLGGYLVASERLSTIATMRWSQVSNLAGLVLIALPGRPLPVALGGFALLGIGVSLPYAAVFNTAAASLRDAPGAGQGMPVIIGNVAILGITPVMGFLVLNYGFTVAWTFVAVLIGIVLAGVPLMKGEEELP
jgi:predicted MFS family arabinose efflux permease